MTVAINPVSRGGGDDLGAIMKAIDIATTMYGAKLNREQADLLAKQKAATEAARIKADADSEAGRRDFESAQTDKKIKAENDLLDKKISAEKQLAGIKSGYLTPDGKTGLSNGPSHERKLANLGATEKQRYDNLILTLKGIREMKAGLLNGQRTFTVPGQGDNNFTQGNRWFVEGLGRMQSGGQISKEEGASFKENTPTFRDKDKDQLAKLDNLEDAMASRLMTLGFNPIDIPDLKKEVRLLGQSGQAIAAPQVPAQDDDAFINSFIGKK